MKIRKLKKLKYKKIKYNFLIKEIRNLVEKNIRVVVVDNIEQHIKDVKFVIGKIKIAKKYKGIKWKF